MSSEAKPEVEFQSVEIPQENIETNGHSFLWKDEGIRGFILNGFYHNTTGPSRCGRCGEFLQYDYDAESNTLTARAVRHTWGRQEVEHNGETHKVPFITHTDDSRPACECPDDLVTTFRLNVPSGRMIVDDSLREVYDADMDGLDYNSALGQHEFFLRMEKVGCAYGFVGNSCPGVYRRPDGTYFIGSPAYDEETDDYVKNDYTEVAGVCTDLWAYSIADYEDWLAKGGKPIEDENMNGTRSVIDVEPGVYEFKHYTGQKDFEHYSSGETIYAEFRRVE